MKLEEEEAEVSTSKKEARISFAVFNEQRLWFFFFFFFVVDLSLLILFRLWLKVQLRIEFLARISPI